MKSFVSLPGPAALRPGLGFLFLICCAGGCGTNPGPRQVTPGIGKAPSVAVRPDAVEVVDLSPVDLNCLRDARMTPEEWSAILGVYVVGSPSSTSPPVIGSYAVGKEAFTFTPRFPLESGIRYRVVLDVSKIPGHTGGGACMESEFFQPKPAVAPTTVVETVYPTRNDLPENQLKFYIHFSAPMSRGEAYPNVRLLDGTGKAVAFPFLELDEELWDPAGKRFTLFFDPGRIKRGLKPREEVGPALEEGKSYTLVIEKKWADAQGNPLKESFQKSFKVGPPDDAPLDPKTWKLMPPPAGKSAPLTVRFPKSLDNALLHRMIWVADAAGKTVPGSVRVTDQQSVWHFTPTQPWPGGDYHLVADTALEDLAGNSIGRPFEVDIFRPIEREDRPKTVQVPFQVRAAE